MKRILSFFAALCMAVTTLAASQGWPANYSGVMLQGFYWNYFNDSNCAWSTWDKVAGQADDIQGYFDLVWIPQSSKASANPSMGYDPMYFFNLDTNFGNKTSLKNMISTLKSKNIGVLADVVINHHGTNNGWFGFPKETYNGVTYQLQSTDVCKNDDGGKAAKEAAKLGVQLSNNNDEGEDWSGMRDLDHNSQNVQTVVKAYQNMLINDLGYAGFRYDMVKGFNGSHIADYNDAANVEFSVGEHWSSKADIISWINSTQKKSAAFDFQFKYNVRDAVEAQDWSKLNSWNNLVRGTEFRRYAITFVENHDTEVRPDGTENGALKADTLAANAYLLAMPGTPCVFLKHWMAYEDAIKAMIQIRKACGITNESNFSILDSQKDHIAISVDGSSKKLLAVIGNEKNYNPGSSWVKVLLGYHFAYYLEKNGTNQAYVDLASGEYLSDQKVTFTTTSTNSNAKIAYTLDGSEPSATHGTQVSSGTSITIKKADGAQTLKAVLIISGAIAGTVVQRDYTFAEPFQIKVYVNAVNGGSNWAPAQPSATSPYINYYSWRGASNNDAAWPGTKITTTETINGIKWFVRTYTINGSNDAINLVFSVNNGTPQTIDVKSIRKTTYLQIRMRKQNDKYVVTDDTDAITAGIEKVENSVKEVRNDDPYYYTLNGMRVLKPTQKGIYIHQGKKIVIR